MSGRSVLRPLPALTPLDNLHNEFKKVPTSILQRDDVAIILPLAFFDLGQFLTFCLELSSCIRLHVPLSLSHA